MKGFDFVDGLFEHNLIHLQYSAVLEKAAGEEGERGRWEAGGSAGHRKGNYSSEKMYWLVFAVLSVLSFPCSGS